MYPARKVPCKFFLSDPQMRIFVVFLDDGPYLVKLHECEKFIKLFKIAVVNIYPELIKLVYACAMRRQVDCSALRFSKFLSLCVEQKGECDPVALAAGFFSCKVHAGYYVYLLVVAAHLKRAVQLVVHVVEVVSLKQYV